MASGERKDGGPAFPRNGHPDRNDLPCDGMTLRDYFAAAAMEGMTRNAFTYMVERPEGDSAQHEVMTDAALAVLKEIGTVAYSMADAMLKAREAPHD